MTGKDVILEPKLAEGDPAEFLLSNSKYHDCHLTVGNPETGDVERIGVSSTHLIAHSSVFRDMLADSTLADPSGSNTHIKDVSPATFKLMLQHVYGGKLPKMTPEEVLDLALCADKYNIQRLVSKVTKRLNPTIAEDFFPALSCAVYISCPDLELRVTKVIQQETENVVQNPNFLELDESCILFIVKQSTLNMSELELWNSLVRWAESQVQNHPEKTLRGCLSKVLPYVRLLVLTVEEIAKYVLPAKILSPDEYMDLTLAVANKQTIKSPSLCNFQEKRVIFREDIKEKYFSDDVLQFNKEYVFNLGKIRNSSLFETERKEFSTLTIEPTKNIKIDSFAFRSFSINYSNANYLPYIEFTFKILVYTFKNGHNESVNSVTSKHRVAPDQTVTCSVMKENGESLILEAGKSYSFRVVVTPPLPTHQLLNRRPFESSNTVYNDGHGMRLKYEDQFHIREIVYRVTE